MAKKKSNRLVLPGDIVQVTDKASQLYLAFLLVGDVRPRFIACGFPVRDKDHVGLEYARLRPDQCAIVGTALLVDGETARARKLAEETLGLLAKEKANG